MTKIRNINVSGRSKIGCYAGPVEHGRGGSRKSPDSFSGASPPVSLNSATIIKSKLSLPVLVLLSGLAIGACDTATGSDRITPVNPGSQVLGCGNPTACNEKTRQSLNRVLGERRALCGDTCEKSASMLGSTEGSYIDGINLARVARGSYVYHSKDSTDYWDTGNTGSGNAMVNYCYNDDDRRYAENYARERMYEY